MEFYFLSQQIINTMLKVLVTLLLKLQLYGYSSKPSVRRENQRPEWEPVTWLDMWAIVCESLLVFKELKTRICLTWAAWVSSCPTKRTVFFTSYWTSVWHPGTLLSCDSFRRPLPSLPHRPQGITVSRLWYTPSLRLPSVLWSLGWLEIHNTRPRGNLQAKNGTLYYRLLCLWEE